MEVSKYVNNRSIMRAKQEKIYTLILGQCTELTHMKLEGLPQWEAPDDIYNGIKLLKMIKNLAHQTIDQKYYLLYLYSSTKSMYC